MRKILSKNINKPIMLALLYVVLDLLSRLPYFNLYLTSWIILLIIWITTIIFFKIEEYANYIFILVILFISVVSVFLGRDSMSIDLGNAIYFLLLTGIIQRISNTFKK